MMRLLAIAGAVKLEPAWSQGHSNLIYTRHFHPDATPAMILEEHRSWNRVHAAPLRSTGRAHENTPEPGRRLRIGYVSADFCGHPIGRFIGPLLAKHEPKRVEVVCHSSVGKGDAAVWRDWCKNPRRR